MAGWAGKPFPDFLVRQVGPGGTAAQEKMKISALAAGRPLVIHFYNGG